MSSTPSLTGIDLAEDAELAARGADNPRVVALDGEVSNSTHADEFVHLFPDRYFEMYSARQQMVAGTLLNAGPQKVWLTHLAVREMPGSGAPGELLSASGVDAGPAAAARALLNAR